MKLEEVMPALLKGKRVRHQGMSDSDYLLYNRGCLVWGDDTPYFFSLDSFTRTDWDIVPESKGGVTTLSNEKEEEK